MIILAIETSCDDTAIAVVKATGKKTPSFKVLSNVVSSQIEAHKEYGGVYPSLAKREHQKNLSPTLIEALQFVIPGESLPTAGGQESRLTQKGLDPRLRGDDNMKKVDAIALTVGPGLDPCLWTGIEFAKSLAQKNSLPIIPVNHIEAHILVNFIEKKPKLPAIALVVSGGHTQIIFVKDIGKYQILGETRDDAAGECFDKTARILGLGYPGGPAIAATAARISNFEFRISKQIQNSKIQNSKFKINLPRPMINTKDYDFSFSGLKTAVLYDFKKREKKGKNYLAAIAKEIQQAVIDVLIKKTLKAANDFRAKTVILGGGVSANEELRKQFAQRIKEKKYDLSLLFPPKNLSTDNAVMIAMAGYYNRSKATKKYEKIKALPNLRI